MNARSMMNPDRQTGKVPPGRLRCPAQAGRVLFAVSLFMLAARTSQGAARDPFWPIGYEPAPTVKAETTVKTAPEPVRVAAPPSIKPIGAADWDAARKNLAISGFTQSVRPDTREERVHVMINRQTYSAGDTLSVTNLGIHFVWRIEAIVDRNLTLAPVTATRLRAETPRLEKEKEPTLKP